MRDFGEAISRFTRLNFLTSKKTLVQPEQPGPPSEQEIEEEAIRQLGRYKEGEVLVSALRRKLDELEIRMMEAVGDNPTMCMIQGAKQEVRSIIAQLEDKEK